MAKKFTPFFPSHIKPVRGGVYQIGNIFFPKAGWCGLWCRWFPNERFLPGTWSSPATSKELAATMKDPRFYPSKSGPYPHQNRPWRGLAENPAANTPVIRGTKKSKGKK